jgi:hypothetical protein
VPTPTKSRFTPWFLAALAALFLFRLAYGLCSEIWFIDQQQVYLIGLKFYSTGQWPFFGADVASGIQLPGALQGLVIGIPLSILPIPESPYILLNLLSFGGLCFFAWYCSKRLPKFPKWILWTWLLTAPWVMNWSTNIDNDSYVIFGSCLFFIGFLESLPSTRLGVLSPYLANGLMGLGLGWNAQFHMSYVIFLPFVLVSAVWEWKEHRSWIEWSKKCTSFLGGALLTGGFIIPTWLQYGFSAGGTGNTILFNSENISSFVTILARFLSLASCEIPRFIGAHTADRLTFLKDHLWMAPFAIVAFVLGTLQAAALLIFWFRKRTDQKDWPVIKRLALFTLLLIYVSFLFAIKAPASHTYYLVLPVAMLYGFYCLAPWSKERWFLRAAGILLVCNIAFHIGLGIDHLNARSLYMNRPLFEKAIQEKNFHLLGERRPNTLY